MSLVATKENVKDEIKKIFYSFQSVEENDVIETHPKLHAESIEIYGSWKKALRESGVTREKIIENQKFYLYCIMKHRYEKYGEEALRPKNIDELTKEEIVNAFKTIKKLKATIIGWNRERVLFEMRKKVLTGTLIYEIEKKHPELYRYAMEYFQDLKTLKECYENLYRNDGEVVIDFVKKKRGRPKKSQSDDLTKFFFTVAKQHGAFEDIDMKEAVNIHKMSKEDIVRSILQKGKESMKKGEVLTEDRLKKEDKVVYHALKIRFGSLRNAFDEAAKSLLA